MYSDDLVPLLSQGPGPGLRFRQGVVRSWNASTGANVVDVAGAQLVDVPILNTGEAIALKAGHVVGLLAFQSTYWIIGRITLPNDPDFAAASVAFGAAGGQAFNFSISTTMTVKTSGTIVVPSWADEALLHVTANASVKNTTANGLFAYIQCGVNGGFGGGIAQGLAPSGSVLAQDIQALGASSRNLLTGLSGGETLTVQASMQADAALAASASNSIFVHAIAIFKSNV